MPRNHYVPQQSSRPSTKPTDYPLWFRIVVVVALAFFVLNLFFFFGPLARFIAWSTTNVTGSQLLSGFGTLVASFIGAFFAFTFAKYQRDKERRNNEVAAGNRALFTLTTMYNELRQHQKEIVDPYRGRPDAWLNLNVSSPLNEKLAIDVKDLSFVMEADPVVFQQALLEEARFRMAVYLIEEHRTLIVSQAWPRMEAAGMRVGDSVLLTDIEKFLGTSLVQRLKVTTNAIIKNFDENVTSSFEAFAKLRTTLKAIYPKRKFIDFKPDA